MGCELIGAAAGCLSRVPDVLWSGVISAVLAASVALLGVWATNRGSLHRLKKQHEADVVESDEQRKHDAHQKAEDRKSLIRREVYTAAVESTHRLIASLARLPERPSDATDDDETLQAFLAANSKVWLVANLEGARLSRQLATEAGEAFIAILRECHGYRVRMDPVREVTAEYAFAKSVASSVAQTSTEARAAGEDATALERRGKVWNEMMGWALNRKARRDELLESLFPEKRALAFHCLETLIPMQATLVQLVSSLRSELGLDPALDIFEALAAEQKARMDALMGTSPAVETPAAS